jgi:hypothetical protein
MFKKALLRISAKASLVSVVACKAVLLVGICVVMLAGGRAHADDRVEVIEIRSPVAWQVIQRQGYIPSRGHYNNSGGPVLGSAEVQLSGTCALEKAPTWKYRLMGQPGAAHQETWQDFSVNQQANEWSGTIQVPAGGWYKLEIRAERNGKVAGQGAVSAFAVGEVFLVAGQSYAAGANDELISVEDREKRVAAYNARTGEWQIANDPQPNVGDGGTIWPPLGDLLVPLLAVPVGFVNVSSGGTASRQWLPDQPLYANMAMVGRSIGRFRAVLWQQGESDVIEKVSTETYVHHLLEIRNGLQKDWGFAPPWLLAKSTHHPMVYRDPSHEAQIRAADEELCKNHGFLAGPDTDILGGIHRGGPGSRQHFSAIGQRRAALLWFASIWPVLSNADASDSTTSAKPQNKSR